LVLLLVSAFASCNHQLKNNQAKNNQNDHYIFLGDLEESAPMNIDAKDIILKLRRREDPQDETKLGSTRSEVYVSENA